MTDKISGTSAVTSVANKDKETQGLRPTQNFRETHTFASANLVRGVETLVKLAATFFSFYSQNPQKCF